MAGSLNRVSLIGHLGADPEVRRTQDGKPIVNLSIATSESWRDRNSGERKEVTEWHRVVIFNEGLAVVAEKYLHKGSKVYLEGQLKTRKWKDQGGTEKFTTEVVLQNFNGTLVMLDGKDGSGGGGGRRDDRDDRDSRSSSRRDDDSPSRGRGGGGGVGTAYDDDIPFGPEWR